MTGQFIRTFITARKTPGSPDGFPFRNGLAVLFVVVTSLAASQVPQPVSPSRKETSVTAPSSSPPTNRLIRATSPYLLQHAHNPVNWYEWGEEALDRARQEDKPIFLSIGYAACHWCHVMEHESFEDQDVAALLNQHFVSIKVDREERPDIDELYMAYTMALTRHGGWPMSVWLRPDGTPFHAGTYFPREHFLALLNQIANAWSHDRDRLSRAADTAQQFFHDWTAGSSTPADFPDQEFIDRAARTIARHFDRERGGMTGGGTNKFPPCMAMDLMLRAHRRTGDPDLLQAVNVTLDHMARGGIYDHLGGGICRYSTDVEWLVPHFEKMLYDQAMVSALYLDAFQLTGNQVYADLASDIFQYVLTDLRDPKGAFYSSRDADSDGLEGKFYVWTVPEIVEVLGDEEARLCCDFFDVTTTGNWFERLGHAPPGPKNILHIAKPPDVFARLHGLTMDELHQRTMLWRKKLGSRRASRTPPALDDKVLTGWNGLMIASLAKGAVVLDRPDLAEAAARAADFILAQLSDGERLLATHRAGRSRLPAYLSDYAFLIEGLLNLYEATGDPQRLNTARRLTDLTIARFADANGAFFFTADDSEKLLARSKHPHDGAIPSGNSVHALNLLRLALLLDRKDLRARAESIFREFSTDARANPSAYERLLCALDFHHDRIKEIVIIGDPASEDTRNLRRAVFDRYLPNKVVVFASDADPDSNFPLLKGKTRRGGKSTAYVCENYGCKKPVTSPQELLEQLEGSRSADR